MTKTKHWTHVKRSGGMGMEEQWIFKPDTAPLCSLKHSDSNVAWCASLLNPSGISTATLYIGLVPLEQAQRECEHELRVMGYEWLS